MTERFRKFAQLCSQAVGSPWAFMAAGAAIVIWALSGPLFDFSDTWQLIINTGTTIVTFLMVFMIQNSQNRDAQAMQLKLDELLCAVENARTQLVDLENLSDGEIERLQKEFRRIRKTETALAEKAAESAAQKAAAGAMENVIEDAAEDAAESAAEKAAERVVQKQQEELGRLPAGDATGVSPRSR
ncbi:MAG: low affinity iron permease family protein [Burkholderiaceae bacterium]